MREFFKIFLISLFLWAGLSSPGVCGVGNTDERFYVNFGEWAKEPYNKFVSLWVIKGEYLLGHCTGQYIAPNLILSAGHCVKKNVGYIAVNYKGVSIPLKLLETPYKDYEDKVADDWAVWKVTDPKNYSDAYFDVQEPMKTVDVLNAGFGWARIIDDDEIEQIREIFYELSKDYDVSDIDELLSALDQELEKHNIQPLQDEHDLFNLKASKCRIVFEDCKKLKKTNEFKTICNNQNLERAAEFPYVLATTCDGWQGNSGGGYVSLDGEDLFGTCSRGRDSFRDYDNSDYIVSSKSFKSRLKQLIQENKPVNTSNTTTSGTGTSTTPAPSQTNVAPVEATVNNPTNTGNTTTTSGTVTSTTPAPSQTNVAPVEAAANKPIDTSNTTTSAPSQQDFVTIGPRPADVGGIVSTEPTIEGVELPGVATSGIMQWDMGDVINNISGDDYVETIEELTEETETMAETLVQDAAKVPDMTNQQVLDYVDTYVSYTVKSEWLEKLKKAYEEAKAKEQSKANRLLTAATVAATGIGGMELAQGLAEQKADKSAEQSMNAYIATMRCEYGKGKSVKAGSEPIELPGGNNENLMKYRNEYFALAADLKTRKEALGMKPGIESEEILDKSQLGLYDDESTGITDGAYASLYRANMLNSEKDKQEIEDAKKTSKNRVVGGGVAAGAGVVGGVVGDALINGTFKKTTTNDDVEEEEE